METNFNPSFYLYIFFLLFHCWESVAGNQKEFVFCFFFQIRFYPSYILSVQVLCLFLVHCTSFSCHLVFPLLSKRFLLLQKNFQVKNKYHANIEEPSNLSPFPFRFSLADKTIFFIRWFITIRVTVFSPVRFCLLHFADCIADLISSGRGSSRRPQGNLPERCLINIAVRRSDKNTKQNKTENGDKWGAKTAWSKKWTSQIYYIIARRVKDCVIDCSFGPVEKCLNNFKRNSVFEKRKRPAGQTRLACGLQVGRISQGHEE